MKINKKAVSIVEAVIVILIISIGLVGVYSIYNNSVRFLDGIASRTTATQMARSGLEAIENIRDTNWLLFSSNRKNCWNVENYDDTCVTGAPTTMSGNYKLYRENNKWLLGKTGSLVNDYNDENYRNFYKVNLDNKGFYTQSGTIVPDVFIDSRNYTRRIEITPTTELTYIDSGGVETTDTTSSSGMTIKSIVEWRDSVSSKPRKVILENILTNYKE